LAELAELAGRYVKSNAFSTGKPFSDRWNIEAIDLLRSHANYIKTSSAVKRIGIFGSFARGEQKASSDIDILVEFEKPTFRNFMNLSFYLEDLLGREVDLVLSRGYIPVSGRMWKRM
jgi:uncharacterized protein